MGIADAATLLMSPSSGTYTIGSTFSVSAYVSSTDQAMNAASGMISFPSDKLEVASLSKEGTIMSLWVQEPSFSNGGGTAAFEGIVLNPGFTGAKGKIITLNFHAKGEGVANITFASGSVLANDGKGTDILRDFGHAQVNITASAPLVPVEENAPVQKSGTPAGPQIVSSTHPDQNQWYAKKDASFSWPVPLGVTAAHILVSKLSQAVPSIMYTPPITSKDIAAIPDGVWYFAAQLRNAAGWGAIAHYKFQIDTVPPEPFAIGFVNGKDSGNPRPAIFFETTDALSGIAGYRMKIGDGDFSPVAGASKDNSLTLPAQPPGKRVLFVQALDKAGNSTTVSAEFIVAALGLPVITEYPARLTVGDPLIVKGTAPLHSTVTIFLQSSRGEPQSQKVATDERGAFALTWNDKPAEGVYRLWARADDDRGASSRDTEQLTILVEPAFFLRLLTGSINYLSLIVILLALILLLALIIGYGWYRWYLLKKRVQRDVHQADNALHKAFDLLQEELREQIKLLEKTRTRRELTAEEEKMIQRFKKNVETAEKFVKKEIDDIAREVS